MARRRGIGGGLGARGRFMRREVARRLLRGMDDGGAGRDVMPATRAVSGEGGHGDPTALPGVASRLSSHRTALIILVGSSCSWRNGGDGVKCRHNTSTCIS